MAVANFAVCNEAFVGLDVSGHRSICETQIIEVNKRNSAEWFIMHLSTSLTAAEMKTRLNFT